MPVHTITLLELTVKHRNGTLGHVSNFSEHQSDLASLWQAFVKETQSSGGSADRERYYLPDRCTWDPRLCEARAEFDVGRFGERQTVRATTTGTAKGIVDIADAATAPLRTLLRVPRTGTRAILALEAAGQRAVTGHLSSDFKKWFRKALRGTGFSLQIKNLNDAAAWKDFIDGADLVGVVFEKRARRGSDRSAPEQIEEYVVKPKSGEMLPKVWIDRLLRRQIRPTDVISVDIGEPERTKVVVERDGRARTLRVGDHLPKFVYEIDPGSEKRPASGRFYAVSTDLIDDVLAVGGS